MERNEKCFCGSGKKYKNCHVNINKDSIVADFIMFYKKLDEKISTELDEKKRVLCKQGCSECCSDFFAITEVEFLIIIDYLVKAKGNEYVEEIIKKGLRADKKFKSTFPDYYKQLEVNADGVSNIEYARLICDNMPNKQGVECPFLNSETKSCDVYEVRPIICREHGICAFNNKYDNKICSKIPSMKDNINNMISIEQLIDEQINLEKYTSKKYNTCIIRRKYPIFYYFKIYFAENNLNDYINHPIQKMLRKLTKEKFINEIIKIRLGE